MNGRGKRDGRVMPLPVVLRLAACASTVRVSASAMGETAGSKDGARTRSKLGPGQRSAEQMCEAQGGVLLAGEDVCAMGGGVE